MPAARPPADASTSPSDAGTAPPEATRRRRNRKPIHRITVSSVTVDAMAALMGRAGVRAAPADAADDADADPADEPSAAALRTAGRRPAPRAADARG